jgi:hypothetical protein
LTLYDSRHHTFSPKNPTNPSQICLSLLEELELLGPVAGVITTSVERTIGVEDDVQRFAMLDLMHWSLAPNLDMHRGNCTHQQPTLGPRIPHTRHIAEACALLGPCSV